MIPSKVRADIKNVTKNIQANLSDYIERPDVIRDEIADLIDNHCHLTFVSSDKNTKEIIKLWLAVNPCTPNIHRNDILNYIDQDIQHFRIDEIDHENIQCFEDMIQDVPDHELRNHYMKIFQHYLSAISLPKNVYYRKQHYHQENQADKNQTDFQNQDLSNQLDNFMQNLNLPKDTKQATDDEQKQSFNSNQPTIEHIRIHHHQHHEQKAIQLSIF